MQSIVFIINKSAVLRLISINKTILHHWHETQVNTSAANQMQEASVLCVCLLQNKRPLQRLTCSSQKLCFFLKSGSSDGAKSHLPNLPATT